MEENKILNPSSNSDPTINRKHAAMLERLSNLHNQRIESSSSANPNSDPSFESVSSFVSHFSSTKQAIENQFQECPRNPYSSDQMLVKSKLNSISNAIEGLEKLLAESSYFLPAYEVRSAQKTISELKQQLNSINSEIVPKKKFSFKNKPTKKNQTSVLEESKVEGFESFPETPLETSSSSNVFDSPGFRNHEGGLLVKDLNDSINGDFTLSDLTNCKIFLKGRLRALFVHRLSGCHVSSGPITGSVLIEEVENCIFMLPSHQIRIHNAKVTDFYLRVKSRPIIEDSSGVRFAPYCKSYEGLDEELHECGLGEETGNWANVDDFKWLRAVQSPNWSIIPEEERVSTIGEVPVQSH
ncbi:hypothetical protein AMTRI_Chr11g99290 [Amborella trichopoda]|uniref:C-CAP/cofactor C-like domain-containing protein n=1 Tax=Amborella trichopoda TaxID=13333 RepID=W1PFG9_AMBTC|nr:tubulin-folding cofactor C [Amborella trichopoda]XP_020524576.1 tubulin-folding cofactor C [Amborella trichopoda]XP_020524577.1 tubulin-folding cofactor C [Amborella trichopoda]XP_020524578.1 tubulin-folding cofactor C [Amborella trichopoda]XP_020524579.1 tubulin-folding cofactor C [Amborella trichopoda]XP_020524581.1 tubulin-folding cofactor C [Amborella trichopoda]ERN08722.1 hypothetical protein AMTR_s00017p00237410 [Amborella trichopoda]|eukprot:XP_006847141.1 tubulin-folding cofactor C [Amborella trichopoda]